MVCPCDVLLVVENQNTLYKHETPTWNNLELDLFQAKFVSRKIRIFFLSPLICSIIELLWLYYYSPLSEQ